MVLETLTNWYAWLTFKDESYARELLKNEMKYDKLKYPIVFHPRYDISGCWIEKLHPYDFCRAGKIFKMLCDLGVIIDEETVHRPSGGVRRAILLWVRAYRTSSRVNTIK